MNKNIVDIFIYVKCFIVYAMIRLTYFGQVKIVSFPKIAHFPIIRGGNGVVRIGKKARINGKLRISFDDCTSTGSLIIGDNFITGGDVTISPRGGKIVIGDNCFVGDGVIIQSFKGGSIVLEDNIMIAHHTSIVGSNHVTDRLDIAMNTQGEFAKSVTIGEDVWLSANVCVLDGVEIAKGTIVAAGAVVNCSLPEYVIAGGVPAKILKNRKCN